MGDTPEQRGQRAACRWPTNAKPLARGTCARVTGPMLSSRGLLLLGLLAAGAACGSCLLDPAGSGAAKRSAAPGGSAAGARDGWPGAQEAAVGGSGGDAGALPLASQASRRALQQGAEKAPLIQGALLFRLPGFSAAWLSHSRLTALLWPPRCRPTRAAAAQGTSARVCPAPAVHHLLG